MEWNIRTPNEMAISFSSTETMILNREFLTKFHRNVKFNVDT